MKGKEKLKPKEVEHSKKKNLLKQDIPYQSTQIFHL